MGYKSQADTELDVADYALEEWAKWALSNNGYGASPSLKIMLDVRRTHVHPSLPHGVEVKGEVINCNIVFGVMRRSEERNQADAIIVKACALARSHGMSFNSLIKNSEFNLLLKYLCKENDVSKIAVSKSRLLNARRNFAGRYALVEYI